MTTIDSLFPSKYLKHSDLDGDTIITIASLSVDEVGMDKEEKPVLHFRGIDKGLVLNRTNAKTLEKLLGRNIETWKGKRVTLYAADVEFKGDMVRSIRIRNTAPAAPTAPVKAITPPEEPTEWVDNETYEETEEAA